MSGIDNRVVKLTMDNKEFESKSKATLDTLDALNKGLKLDGAKKSLSEVADATKNFSLEHIGNAIDGIANKFKALSIVGITVLTNLANKAVDAGLQLAKSLTIDPIKSGLSEYETNLNAIQTILSNTAWQGTGLDDVNKALNELNIYSDKTIYNFSEMARNIGTFTAAGVKLDTSVNAIKGIANLAAISGSSAEQASTAMYQLSQALATGVLHLQDWNSVVNAGMGGKVFQDALIETARVHGVAVDKIIKDEGSFRDSLQKGWLTSSILTETLSKFTGDLTAAQLKTMGYNDKQIAGILKMGKDAQDAATKVKTFSQLINTLQESAGSGWASTWQIIFGDFEEARTLFTNVNNVLGGFITASANARNKVLGDWKELGGRTVLIKAISNAFDALISVLKPIKDAFRQIFPATTGKQLYDFTVALEKFTEKLKIGGKTADELKRTFAGFFAILGIALDIIKAIVGALFDLGGAATKSSGGILAITAKIGDFLVGLHKAIEEGNGITEFFKALGRVLALPIRLISTIATAIGNLFGHFKAKDAAKDTANWASKLEIITKILNAIADGGDHLGEVLSAAGQKLVPILKKVADFLAGVGTWIKNALKGVKWDDVLNTVDTGLFAALVLLVQRYGKTFLDIIKKLFGKKEETGGILDSLKESFDGLTKTLGAMQTTLKAATLLELAAAILILSIAVVAMSKVDPANLTAAMGAITVMMAELFSSMAIFEKIAGSKGFAKMPFVTASMILLATAINIMVTAVSRLAELDWVALSRGMSGLTLILGELILALRLMPNQEKMISSGLSLILMATAIDILSKAVGNFAKLSWNDMERGLAGVAGVLTALSLYSKFGEGEKTGILAGAGLLLLAVAIKILGTTFSSFGSMNWSSIEKGLVTMAGLLLIMSIALDTIPPTAILGAAGAILLAEAMVMIAKPLQEMGNMSWMEILKGLTAMLGALTLMTAALYLIPPTAILGAAGLLVAADAMGPIVDFLERTGKMSWGGISKAMVALTGALTILGIALTLMIVALPGAAALLVVSAALVILLPILAALSVMSWSAIGKGLLALAAVFLTLAAAALVVTPAIPSLLLLATAIGILGVAMLAGGLGMLEFSLALVVLKEAGTAAFTTLNALIKGLADLIPYVLTKIGEGLIAFAEVIAKSGPAIVGALVTVLNALLDAIVQVTPKIQLTLAKLLLGMLVILAAYVPDMVRAGLKLLTGVLQGIADNIDRVVTAATNIVVNFINSLGKNLPRIIQAGVDFILSFIRGLTDAINKNSEAMGKAGADLGLAIVKGIARGIAGGAGEIADAARDAAKSALNAAKNFLGIKSPSKKAQEEIGKPFAQGAAKGITKNAYLIEDATTGVANTALDSMTAALSDMSDILPDHLELSPTITPVLDLTRVSKDAGSLDNMFKAGVISVEPAASSARNASSRFKDRYPSDENSSGGDSSSTIYNQYNYSPKALSEADIYRQTKNQLSSTKSTLPTTPKGAPQT